LVAVASVIISVVVAVIARREEQRSADVARREEERSLFRVTFADATREHFDRNRDRLALLDRAVDEIGTFVVKIKTDKSFASFGDARLLEFIANAVAMRAVSLTVELSVLQTIFRQHAALVDADPPPKAIEIIKNLEDLAVRASTLLKLPESVKRLDGTDWDDNWDNLIILWLAGAASLKIDIRELSTKLNAQFNTFSDIVAERPHNARNAARAATHE
jgi:hypothetical protein